MDTTTDDLLAPIQMPITHVADSIQMPVEKMVRAPFVYSGPLQSLPMSDEDVEPYRTPNDLWLDMLVWRAAVESGEIDFEPEVEAEWKAAIQDCIDQMTEYLKNWKSPEWTVLDERVVEWSEEQFKFVEKLLAEVKQ